LGVINKPRAIVICKGGRRFRAGVWLGLVLFPLLSFGQASFQRRIRGVVREIVARFEL